MDKNTGQLQGFFFTVENVKLCIPLENINKVLPLPQLEIVPGCPDYLAGLLNLAGHIIPVFDLAIRLGLQRKISYTINTPVIICADKSNTSKIGLIVDKITDIQFIDKSTLQMQSELNNPVLPFTAVIGNAGSELLINIEYLLKFDLLSNSMSKINNQLLDTVEKA